MSVTQYIGARYVPDFAEPLEWDKSKTYEPLTIVYYQGNSYTSRQSVPRGIDLDNANYWALTGNYNAQIEQYRKDVERVKTDVDTANSTANSAKTVANNAMGDANRAQNAADVAKTSAAKAQSTADSAKTSATNAQSTADSAKTSATKAQSTADSAKTTATKAQSTADSAKTTATNAINLANENKLKLDSFSYDPIPAGKMAIYGDSWTTFEYSHVGNFGESIKNISNNKISYTSYGVSGGTLINSGKSIQSCIKTAKYDDTVKYAILVGGINDCASDNYNENNTINGFKECIDLIKAKNPNAVIYTAIGNGLPPVKNFTSTLRAITLNHKCAEIAETMQNVKTLKNTLTWYTSATETSFSSLMDNTRVHINQKACDKYFGPLIYNQLERNIEYLNEYEFLLKYPSNTSLGDAEMEITVRQYNNVFYFYFYSWNTEKTSIENTTVYIFKKEYTFDNPKQCILNLVKNCISSHSRAKTYKIHKDNEINIIPNKSEGTTFIASYTTNTADIGVTGSYTTII